MQFGLPRNDLDQLFDVLLRSRTEGFALMLSEGVYKKSTYSGAVCVQVALFTDGSVGVKNSRNATLEHVFTADEWKAFVAGVKDGEFDYPL
jgi:hypothetical protein